MPLLYEPHKPEDTYSLTPAWDDTLTDWVTLHPDQPHGPRFTVAEADAFTFTWPTDEPPTIHPARAANGQFVKNAG